VREWLAFEMSALEGIVHGEIEHLSSVRREVARD